MSKAMGVLLRGLPFEADQDDVRQFFVSLNVPLNNVEMIYTFDEKFSGLCFVRLHSPEEVKMALLMDRNHMGGRYIDVMTATEEKLDQIKKAACNGLGRRELHRMCGDSRPINVDHRDRYGGGGHSRRGSDRRHRSRSPVQRDPTPDRFAYFNGFPSEVLYKGVRNFFSDCLIGKGCVHLFHDDHGKFRGDGYVEFTDSSQLKKALRKDRMLFRGRRIDVEPCSRDEVYDNLRFMMDRVGQGGRGSSPDSAYNGSYRRPGEREIRYGDRSRESVDRDKWGTGGGRRSYHRSRSSDNSDLDDGGRRHDSGYRGGAYNDRGYHRSVDHNESVGGSSYTSDHHHHGGGGNGGGRNSSTSEGRTLKMHGIPSSTRISDIVSFFKNYGVEYEDVRIQCHDDGTPNGRAFVTFPSERLSSAAYHDMNRRMIKSAYIELLPV